jgi:putative CocE/NonD family hydrolase
VTNPERVLGARLTSRRPGGLRLRTVLLAVLSAASLGLPALLVGSPPAGAAPNRYVTMPDGIKLAINVRMPDGYVAGKRYPVLFEMNGYDGGSAEDGTLVNDFGLSSVPGLPTGDSRQITRRFNQQYVTVHASVRGTGCSGGEFDLFSSQTGQDGKYIIDEYLAKQPWSNGKVGVIGHSYGGITGFQIVAAQPKHLVAASLSGLIDDVYRGMVYPGGVTNYGFPLLWTGAVRPLYDVAGGLLPGIVRAEESDDDPNRQETCAGNTAQKSRTITNDPLLQGLSDTDDDWYRARSLIEQVSKVKVPIHITGAYQDEQTGPRGPFDLWEHINGVPKRLVATNGDHNTQNPGSAPMKVWADRKGWLDHWLGVKMNTALYGTRLENKKSVQVLLETHRDGSGELVPNSVIDASSFPLPSTIFTPYYLQPGGALSSAKPGLTGGSDPYFSGLPRHAWSYQAGATAGPPFTTADAPDHLVYKTPAFTKAMVIAGPVLADLHISSTAPDTELFVQLIDEGADGSRTYLQRGVLKASHRAIDATRSDSFNGFRYRPFRPHVNPTLQLPGTVTRYEVEVWPVGHVFRPGHKLLVLVTSPPLVDSYYAYVPKTLIGLNTLYHDAARPSRVVVPVVPAPANLGPELPCGAQEAVRCIPKPNG